MTTDKKDDQRQETILILPMPSDGYNLPAEAREWLRLMALAEYSPAALPILEALIPDQIQRPVCRRCGSSDGIDSTVRGG